MAKFKLFVWQIVCTLGLVTHHVSASTQRGMIKLHVRQHHLDSSDDGTPRQVGEADPGLSLAQDSDADLSLQHDESMRLFMRTKAESVIASHAGDSLSTYDVESILTGEIPSLHPGSLTNVSFTRDLFETGTTLPTVSSKSHPHSMDSFSLLSTSSSQNAASPDDDNLGLDITDDRDLNHDGIVSVDELLQSFFHADDVKLTFDKVQSQRNEKLGKEGKKAIIKETAPTLHKTIEKVAGPRGWGIQDARFAQLHQQGDQQGHGAFQDYNTFVKTMRNALITPTDAAKDSAQEEEQERSGSTDPTTKA